MEYINTSDTVASWILIIVILLVIVIIYKAVFGSIMSVIKREDGTKDRGNETGMEPYSGEEIRDIIDGYKLHINKFNTLIKYYPKAEKELRDKAIELQDKKALSFASRQAMKFSEAMEEAGKMFNAAEEAAKLKETGKMADFIVEFSSDVDLMRIIYDGVEGYKVEDRRPDPETRHKSQRQEGKTGLEKNPENNRIFFEGCRNMKDVEKRYRALCKAYHPDQGYGEERIFRQLNEEYEETKKRLKEKGK